MFELPPLPPSWDGYHPLVVHFPIALLAVAPIFVLLGALTGARSIMVSALLLLLMGVGGAFLATNTGDEAYAVADPNYDLETEEDPWEVDPYEVAEEHGERSEFARNVFAGITGVYAVVVLLAFVKPSSTKFAPRILTGLVLVAALGWANLLLANAAHLGGELVHRFGVRAALEDLEDAELIQEATDGEAAAGDSEEAAAEEAADEPEEEPAGDEGQSTEEEPAEGQSAQQEPAEQEPAEEKPTGDAAEDAANEADATAEQPEQDQPAPTE